MTLPGPEKDPSLDECDSGRTGSVVSSGGCDLLSDDFTFSLMHIYASDRHDILDGDDDDDGD